MERVKRIDMIIDDVPLSAFVVDEGEEATIGGEKVEFFDPATIPVEGKVKPFESLTMSRMIATQELRKKIDSRKDVYAYLFYLARGDAYPFVAIRVEDSEKEVSIKACP